MPRTICAVVGCGSRGDRDSNSFFRIPSIPKKGSPHIVQLKKERYQKWIVALKRKDLSEDKMKHIRICDKHFVTGRPAAFADVGNPDWVPSVLMGSETASNPASLTTEPLIVTLPSGYNRPLVDVPSSQVLLRAARTISHSQVIALPSPADRWYNQTSEITETEQTPQWTSAPKDGDNSLKNSCPVKTKAEKKDEVDAKSRLKNVETQTNLRMEDIDYMSEVVKEQILEICDLKQKLNSYVDTEDTINPASLLEFTMHT